MKEKNNNVKNQSRLLKVNLPIPFYWWALPKEKILESLHVDPKNGLSIKQVQEHRAIFGANVLKELKPTSIWRLVLEGIKQPMMVLLLSIAAISFIFRELVEGVVMIFVVAAYISVEFINKFRCRSHHGSAQRTHPTHHQSHSRRQGTGDSHSRCGCWRSDNTLCWRSRRS